MQQATLNFTNRDIVILGLARQGTALARFFAQQGARVTVSDVRNAEQLRAECESLAPFGVKFVLGEHPPSLLDRCDLLCLSGGVPTDLPLVRSARDRRIPLSNDSLLTLQLCPAPVIGITGSSGKTTTTTLVGRILEASGRRTHVGGNIGTPLIDRLEQVQASDAVVTELSSFQLELFDPSVSPGGDVSPHIAAVLNVTPNHLDRHPSMSHYTAAKANILRWQSAGDVAVLGCDNPVTGRWWQEHAVHIGADTGQEDRTFSVQGRLLGFSLRQEVDQGAFLRRERLVLRWEEQEEAIINVDEMQIPGAHNVLNALAACAISAPAGGTTAAMREVLHSFRGVPHRLEIVRVHKEVTWINDSIATAPERAVAALRSMYRPVILLAGGRDKKLPWDEFAQEVRRRVRHLITFGEAAPLIEARVQGQKSGIESLATASSPNNKEASPAAKACTTAAAGSIPDLCPITRCVDLEEAVAVAARIAQAGDVVLLAPGGASFDAYRDFEERGQHFRRLVQALS